MAIYVTSFAYPCLVLPDAVLAAIRLAVIVHRAVWVLHVAWAQDGRQGASDSGRQRHLTKLRDVRVHKRPRRPTVGPDMRLRLTLEKPIVAALPKGIVPLLREVRHWQSDEAIHDVVLHLIIGEQGGRCAGRWALFVLRLGADGR